MLPENLRTVAFRLDLDETGTATVDLLLESEGDDPRHVTGVIPPATMAQIGMIAGAMIPMIDTDELMGQVQEAASGVAIIPDDPSDLD